MKMTFSSNLKSYEIRDVMAINFTGGTLTVIYKDWDTDTVHTSQYTAESMNKSGNIIITA